VNPNDQGADPEQVASPGQAQQGWNIMYMLRVISNLHLITFVGKYRAKLNGDFSEFWHTGYLIIMYKKKSRNIIIKKTTKKWKE